ncbi:MAG: hypothetical protein SFW64_07935 [Alphaproteobacteria bacterium]|nr:hypothetical protein [Alphaproteobacteria bacterium]
MMKPILRRLPPALLATLLISVPYLLYALSKWHAMPLHDGIPIGQTDPDTWLRLTLVRDWLLGGGWYNHSVAHSNAPWGGISSPWTRPLDLVIALLVRAQPESVELSVRLMRASLLLPVLWMTLLVVGIHRAIRALLPLPSAYIMAGALIATQPMMWNYFSLGNADHHAPLSVLFIWVMGGILTPHPSRRLMLLTGMLLGLQLWISVEAMVLIAAIYLWVGLGWLRGETAKAVALAQLTTGVALTALLAVMIERPVAAWLTPVYDSISVVHVIALLLCAVLAALLHHVPVRHLRGRLVLAATGGGALLGGLLLTYPLLLHGPMVGVEPFIHSDFLPHISEAKPFYKISPLLLMAATLTPLLGIILCLAPWIRPDRAFYPREHSAQLVFFLGVTLLLYYFQQRWSYYMLPLAVVALAPLLGALFTPEHPHVATRWPANLLAGLPPTTQMKRRLPVILALLGAPFMLLLQGAAPSVTDKLSPLTSTASPTADAQAKQRDACYRKARVLIRSGALMRALPDTPLTFLAPTDLGAELLFFTPQRIIASNYHREGAGIRYVWEADTIAEPSSLHAYLKKRTVEALLLCPKVGPTKDSLLQAYVQGAPLPAWLKPVPYTLPPSPTTEKDASAPPAPDPLLLRIVAP